LRVKKRIVNWNFRNQCLGSARRKMTVIKSNIPAAVLANNCGRSLAEISIWRLVLQCEAQQVCRRREVGRERARERASRKESDSRGEGEGVMVRRNRGADVYATAPEVAADVGREAAAPGSGDATRLPGLLPPGRRRLEEVGRDDAGRDVGGVGLTKSSPPPCAGACVVSA